MIHPENAFASLFITLFCIFVFSIHPTETCRQWRNLLARHRGRFANGETFSQGSVAVSRMAKSPRKASRPFREWRNFLARHHSRFANGGNISQPVSDK
jgi:hypothetical protein